MGEIDVGALLYGERGHICQFTGRSPAFEGRQSFPMEFDDGEAIDTDGDHCWAVGDFPSDRPVARTLTTAAMGDGVTMGTWQAPA